MPTIYDEQVTENDLLTELAAQLTAQDRSRKPGDVTVSDLMQATGKSKWECTRFLESEVTAGRLQKVPGIIYGGKRIVVYRRK